MLSPEQFNKIVLKEDLDTILDAKFDEKLEPLKSEILQAIDGLAKKLDNVQIELASNIVAHDRFETRITHLEKTLL